MKKEELAETFKEVAGDIMKGVEDKTDALRKEVKDAVAKELDELRGEVKSKIDLAAEVKKVDVEVKEPEPEFIRDSGEYFKMVAKAATDPRAKESLAKGLEVHWKAPSGMNTVVDSEGGFLPTSQIVNDIQERMYQTGQLVADCDMQPISGSNDRFEWREAVEDDRTTEGSVMGIRAYRTSEGNSVTASKSEFRKREIAVEDMMIYVPVTRQLLSDSVGLASFINRNAPKAFGKKLDKEIVRGTGAGQCLGILNAAATISIAKESGQAADTIVKENIEKMYDSLDPDLLAGAKWYINPHARKELRNMTMAVGTGGAPVYLPEGTIAGQPFGTLLGLPVVPTNACSKLGDAGDIILANMSEYLLVEKGGIEAAESMHILFLTNEMAYRFTARNNGMPKLASAITPENGNTGDKLSAYITLAARA